VDAVPAHLLPDRIEGEVMDAGTLLGRGISFPPRVGADGRIAWSAGEDNIRDAIRIILGTERNERLRLPEFGAGLRRFLFEPNTVATRQRLEDGILRALAAWEPRISVQSVDVDEDPDDAESTIATIEYKLVATQVSERITVAVALAA
jgi:phage baseplate assembly protein W